MKELRVGRSYFTCKSVNVLCKLMNKGFKPDIIKESEFHEGVWIWYFKTTKELVDALGEIFPDCTVKVMA